MSEATVLEAMQLNLAKRVKKIDKKDKSLYGKVHAKDDLSAYCQYIDPDFTLPKHIKTIIEHLKKIEKGELKRVIINIPPGHGKSYLTSILFPTWYIGRYPKSQIMVTGHTESLAADTFTLKQLNIVKRDEYKTIFPEMKLDSSMGKKSLWRTTMNGQVMGAGTDGPVTGHRADLLIIDDPIKTMMEAKSEKVMDNLFEWYVSVVRSRLNPGGRIIIIMHRWTTQDLVGRILERDKTTDNGGKWCMIKMPAIDSKGNALWPERYSLDELYDIRSTVGNSEWSSKYQQEPIDLVEKLFIDPKYANIPEKLTKFAYLDPAFGGEDYSALTIGGISKTGKDANIYITMGLIWKGQIDQTYNLVERICKENSVYTLYIEDNQAQIVLVTEFQKRGLYTKGIRNVNNKHLRIVNNVLVNWKRIYFSNDINKDYMKQILNYSEYSRHDDAPDSLAGLVGAIIDGTRTGVSITPKFFRLNK